MEVPIMSVSKRIPCLLSFLALAAPLAHAQNLELRKAGVETPLHVVPLLAGAEQSLDAAGNVRLRCVDANNDNTCDGLALSGGTAPTMPQFLLTAPTPEGAARPSIAVGQTFYVNWSTANAEVCVANGPVELSGWSGLQTLNGTGNVPAAGLRFTSVPAAGSLPASVGLTCFGAGGRIQRTSLIDVVAGTNPQPANCIRNGGTFLFNPSGWLNSGLTWQQLGGSAQYPPVNVSPRVPLDQKQFISLPFVARQVENMNYFVAPDGALGTGYEGFYLTISECSGDFRSPSSNANVLADEPTLDASCRMFFSGKIEKRIFTTDAVAGQCRVIPGRSYFLNIIQAGGPDSILQGQSLCPSARCSFLSNFRG
jgi:hypothetical protein